MSRSDLRLRRHARRIGIIDHVVRNRSRVAWSYAQRCLRGVCHGPAWKITWAAPRVILVFDLLSQRGHSLPGNPSGFERW